MDIALWVSLFENNNNNNNNTLERVDFSVILIMPHKIDSEPFDLKVLFY
jgi:hypothetical protein